MSQIKKLKLNLSQTIALVVSVSSAVLLITFLVRAWVEPFAVPPGGTVYTPVHTGPTAQTKEGNFEVNALSTYDTTISDNTIETGTLCLGNGTNCQSEWPSGEFTFAAGNTLLASSDAVVAGATSSPLPLSYVLTKQILIGSGGILRIKFDLGGTNWSGLSVYAKIYHNGSPVGTQRSVIAVGGNPSYTTFSEDISGWLPGDSVQLYAHSTYSGTYARFYVRNFRIYVDNYPGVPEYY